MDINFNEIEKKRQKKRTSEQVYKASEDPDKKKFYVMDMFPYPSGAGLHVGHPKGYVASDTLARKKMLEGFSVLHPMGFDTFGLGTEQLAIDKKMKPQDLADTNIAYYRQQLEGIGFSYDWERTFSTADPDYYRRTQWIFLQLYNHYYDEEEKRARPVSEFTPLRKGGAEGNEAGGFVNGESTQGIPPTPLCERGLQRLAYIDYKPINWCPHCKTGLANEDLEDGKCERCGSEVEQKPMRQWVLRITKYADRLLEGLEELEWDESMKELERNWIGKSSGTQFKMSVSRRDPAVLRGPNGEIIAKGTHDSRDDGLPRPNPASVVNNEELFFEVFTTRVDTVFGMTFVVMAPEHYLVDIITTEEYKSAVLAYKNQAKHKTQLERTELQKEKTGQFTGAYAINPFNGIEIPIFIGDYVLANYGTGVVMAVPAHDERDYEFAKKYDIPIVQSIMPTLYEDKGAGKFRPDKPLTERTVVSAYLKHRSEDKVLILDRNEFGWKTFVMGGAEAGENPEEAMIREIREETGYVNIKSISKAPTDIQTYFYAAHKDVCRKAHELLFIVELADGEQRATSEENTKNHNYRRVDSKEVEGSINTMGHTALLNYYLQPRANTEKGTLINSGEFSGFSSEEAMKAMHTRLEERGLGEEKNNYKIQDWVFSRQRYWGEPFPVVFCDHCGNTLLTRAPHEAAEKGGSDAVPRTSCGEGAGGSNNTKNEAFTNEPPLPLLQKEGSVAVISLPESDLPLTLPDIENYEPTGREEGPLDDVDRWMKTTCPACGQEARRESNTMPGRAGSSRYRLRYMDPKNDKSLVDKEKEKYRGNVDVYVGGAEHVTRHMIYARFWQKFLYDIGMVSHQEPFQRYEKVGLIMAEDGRKMSKRRGNVVNPDDVIAEYGADAFRTYEMFMGPFDQSISRNTNGMKGVKKFLDKVVALRDKVSPPSEGGCSKGAEGSNILRNAKLSPNTQLRINGKTYQVLSKAKYTTKEGGDEYIKTFLSDEHTLVFPLDGSNVVLLVKHYGAILPEFPTPATFTFQEYKYQQVLRDRQILQEVYFGEKGNYEEDLEIIDYECKDNNDLFISVGLLPETQERADLAGSIIDEKSIERIGEDVEQAVGRDEGSPRPSEAKNETVQNPPYPLLHSIQDRLLGKGMQKEVEALLHQTIKKTTEDIDAFRFNTTIAQFMILVNKLSELEKVDREVFQTFIILLAPFAPHLAEEFWSLLGNEFSIFTKAKRPKRDEKKLISDTVNLAIQFNGKVRGTIEVSPDASEEEVLGIIKGEIASASPRNELEKLATYLASGEVKKVIYVPGKIMNVVVG